MSDKVTVITFTDPMMGLSYESEPVFRKLETHFAEKIEFKYLMSVLVKNVYDFVNPADLSISREFALKNYNAKLARIYESEESISGMPIIMTDFQLFSIHETTSLPLNLAYKSAQLVDESKAEQFLYNLRYATIVDCKQTTRLEEILNVVRKTGLDEEKFLKHFKGETSKEKLKEDLNFAYKLRIRTLPAYLIEYNGEGVLFQELLGYEDFIRIIEKLTGGAVKPKGAEKLERALRKLLERHPLISSVELREAFDFGSMDEVKKFIAPLIENGEIKIVEVERGWFAKKIQVIR